MPKAGECLFIKKRMIKASETESFMYDSNATDMEPKEAIEKGWKLKHFVHYHTDTHLYKEHYFVWPDLFKEAVAAGMAAPDVSCDVPGVS